MASRSRPNPFTRGSAAAWLVTAPLVGIAGARLARFDDHPLLSAANAGTPLVYLPAYGALALGVLTGRRALATAAGCVAGCHVAWTAPELRRPRPLPTDLRTGPRLRVVTSNVRFNSPDSTALGRELAAAEADILFVQELGLDHVRMLKAAGAFDRFDYSFVDARRGSFGGGIWSRYPLSQEDILEVDGHPTGRATVDVDGTAIRLFNVHAKAPSRGWAIPRWKAQLAALGREVLADPRAVILAGDFNSTYGHKPFRDLLATGVRDAHVEAGRGLARTWPANLRVVPPVFRLDHVLVSPDLDVLAVRELPARSSDHRPVVADLAVSRRSGTQPARRSGTQPARRSGTQPARRSGRQPALSAKDG